MQNTLTLRRTGEFTVATHGTSPCGVQNPQLIQYVFIATCAAKLDDRDFLFEQREVDAFFQSRSSTDASCEKLAIQWTEQLIAHVLKDSPDCQILMTTLELKAAPFFASMTYTWTSPAASGGPALYVALGDRMGLFRRETLLTEAASYKDFVDEDGRSGVLVFKNSGSTVARVFYKVSADLYTEDWQS